MMNIMNKDIPFDNANSTINYQVEYNKLKNYL